MWRKLHTKLLISKTLVWIHLGNSNGYIFPFLLCISLFFFSQLFIRPPQTTILPFCISFSWGWSWSLPPVQCHDPPSIVLQALCLSDLIHWIYLSLPLFNHMGFDLGHTWMAYFLQFKPESCYKQLMIWATLRINYTDLSSLSNWIILLEVSHN